MYLVQILLPLYDREGNSFPRAAFERVGAELVERFGGMTAYAQAPARGLWEKDDGVTERDDILVHEVMAEEVDEVWWADYRRDLESRFDQEELVIRALTMRRS